MINPDIVHGMTYGGIAHGIGAALYEKFTYDDHGQLTSGTFMDYLIPSALEVPPITIVDHCTPSPLTTFGQKGSGEAGYLGAPAARRQCGQRRAGAARRRDEHAADVPSRDLGDDRTGERRELGGETAGCSDPAVAGMPSNQRLIASNALSPEC